jgi:hypothetical protein
MEKAYGYIVTIGLLVFGFACIQAGYIGWGIGGIVFGIFALIGTLNTP